MVFPLDLEIWGSGAATLRGESSRTDNFSMPVTVLGTQEREKERETGGTCRSSVMCLYLIVRVPFDVCDPRPHHCESQGVGVVQR